MASKLFQMLGLLEEATRHSSNATNALNALDETVPVKLVNKHLVKIADRESLISEFLEHIAHSRAFEEEEGEYEE